MIIKLYN